jgi:hypothetical protein
MTTVTPEKVEQELLELSFLEDSVKCGDWRRVGCSNDATHMIICPCKVGKALMCDECLAVLSEFSRTRLLGLVRPRVFFDRSCRHAVALKDCAVLPI